MSGIKELETLLASMEPALKETDYVFCTLDGSVSEYVSLNPIGIFCEEEGVTLVLEKSMAEEADLAFSGTFKQITLTVHSSLEAVGLTAAISNKLANRGISANVIAAYYHDHIFVPADKADDALAALKEFSA
ncbi:ACT domain-containing protein [Marinomonas dokdonensis]|uniref:ACT domain-containing protein n=1 Tax=Marinomonas dokdonensis TaxID=328224 RepID=UPI004055464C